MTEPQPKRKRVLPPPAQLRQQQLSIAFDSTGLLGLADAERRKAVNQLSQLLLQAAGVATEESDDER